MYNQDLLKRIKLWKGLYASGVLDAIQTNRPIEVYSYTEKKWLPCPEPNFGILPASCYRVKNDK